jgi:hypothetical protein
MRITHEKWTEKFEEVGLFPFDPGFAAAIFVP